MARHKRPAKGSNKGFSLLSWMRSSLLYSWRHFYKQLVSTVNEKETNKNTSETRVQEDLEKRNRENKHNLQQRNTENDDKDRDWKNENNLKEEITQQIHHNKKEENEMEEI